VPKHPLGRLTGTQAANGHTGERTPKRGEASTRKGREVDRMFFNEILVAFFILVAACGRAGW
jgi:hypothetical protein